MAGPKGSALPGTPAQRSEQIVLHVDADCFFAACERLREPKLRGEPVIIGMGYTEDDTRGAVATASYEAREYGIESAQPISQAIERLPPNDSTDESVGETGYYRPVDMAYYESIGEDVAAILDESADVVRRVSIDEAYLDVTERTEWSVAEGFARHIKDQIRRTIGITVSIGVAPSMSVAKVASDFDKPNGLTVVFPDDVESFLADLPIERIHGVGPVTATELRSMDIETAGDIASANPQTLETQFGERGFELYNRARGNDTRPVTPTGRPKSFSRESAIDDSELELEDIQQILNQLASDVADRARRNDALYRTVGIKVVTTPYQVNTREQSLSGPVDDPDLVEEIALSLFDEFTDSRVRKLGVRLANLSFTTSDQSDLKAWKPTGDSSSVRSIHPDIESSSDGQQSLDDFFE